MSIIKISGNMKVKTLKERFRKTFSLSLWLYNNNGEAADDNLTISEIRKEGVGGGQLHIRKNILIRNIEKRLEDDFGIKAEIRGLDDGEIENKEATLKEVIEKSMTTKPSNTRKTKDETELDNREVDDNRKIFFFSLSTSRNLKDEDYGVDDIVMVDEGPEDYPDNAFSIMFSYISDLANELIEAIETRACSGKYYIIIEGTEGHEDIIIPHSELLNSRERIPPVTLEYILTEGRLHVAVLTDDDIDQWDYNFLKASEYFAGTFTVYGPHPEHRLARQIYDDGEYDTGIEVDPDDPEYTEESERNYKFIELGKKLEN